MDYRKITAIVPSLKLEAVQEKLKHFRVPCISVMEVMGYGELPDFFDCDWTLDNVRVEMYVGSDKAQELAQAIMEVAYTGGEDDGFVAIAPVEALFRIRTGKLVNTQ